MEELLKEYERWKHLKGISPAKKKDSRSEDLKALTAEYAKWKQQRRNDGGGGGRGGGGGVKEGRGGNSKDDLLRDSLKDFESWKRLRAEEAEIVRRG